LRDVEGKEIGDPKIRAKEGLEELFPNVGVLIDINVSEAQRANLNLKPVHSPRHDMQVFEILS
jgi:hypothetical protein